MKMAFSLHLTLQQCDCNVYFCPGNKLGSHGESSGFCGQPNYQKILKHKEGMLHVKKYTYLAKL